MPQSQTLATMLATHMLAWVVLTSGCHEAQAPVPEAQRAPIATTSPVPGSAQLLLQGHVSRAHSKAIVTAAADARVVRLFVKPGDDIKAGSAIADVVMASVLAAAADLVAAETQRAPLAQRLMQLKELRLAGMAKASDEADITIALANVDAARARATATLRSADLAPEQAAGVLERGVVTMRAPRAGIVVDVAVHVGEGLAFGAAIATIVGMGDEMRVAIHSTVPLQNDARAETSCDGKKTILKLLTQAPAVDARDGTRLTWFVATDDEGTKACANMSDGATLDLSLLVAQRLTLPPSAVSVDAHGAHVAYKEGDAFVRRDVTVLGRSQDGLLVVDGLTASDVVAAHVRMALVDAGAAHDH